jgi:hypothetical protein
MAMNLAQCIDACHNQFPFQPHAVDSGRLLASLLEASDFLANANLQYSISHTTVSAFYHSDSPVPQRWINLSAIEQELQIALLENTGSEPRTIRDVTHSKRDDAIQDLSEFVSLLNSNPL